jgi:hypothetical protein
VKQHRASAAVLEPHLTKIVPICKICQPGETGRGRSQMPGPGDARDQIAKVREVGNYDEYLPMNIERFCDFFSLGI